MTFTTKQNSNISSDDATQDILLDEKEHLEREKNSKTFKLFLKKLVLVGVGLSISVICALLIPPQKAHATTATPSAQKGLFGYSQTLPLRSQETINSNYSSFSRPSIPHDESHSKLELGSSQSHGRTGKPLIYEQKKKNHCSPIRVIQPQSSISPQFDIGQGAIQIKKEVEDTFKKDTIIINMNEIFQNTEIKLRYGIVANRFIDCTRTSRQETVDLEYGLARFCDYSHVNENTTFTKEEVDIVPQKMIASWLLLSTDYKERNSIINKIKYFVFHGNNPSFATIGDADKWHGYKRERYILLNQALERQVLPKLKTPLADDVDALRVDYTSATNFLTLEVYSHTPMYLHSKYTEICDIFFDHFNSNYVIENPSFIHWIPNSWKYHVDQNQNKNLSVILAKKAVAKAITTIEGENLIAHFDRKNAGQPPYAQRYKTLTGREPTVPFNRHNLACIPAAFSNIANPSEIDETAYL